MQRVPGRLAQGRVAGQAALILRRLTAIVAAVLTLFPAQDAGADITTPSAARATSQFGHGLFVDNLIDGSGLDGSGPLEGQLHDNNEPNMWISGCADAGIAGGTPLESCAKNPFAVAPVTEQILEFELDTSYDLNAVLIWQYNKFESPSRGVSSLELLVSPSRTAEFASLGTFELTNSMPDPAAGVFSEPAQTLDVDGLEGTDVVRRVRMRVLDDHGGDGFVGLSEVRFEGEAISPIGDPFAIEIVDSQTGRGVPLIELTSPDGRSTVTDSNGLVTFNEPELMGTLVLFDVSGYGYSGFQQSLRPTPGGTVRVPMDRVNLAERLYRLTGTGIYETSVTLGRSVPIEEPLLNANVRGQDSVQRTIYKGQIRWFWGDTLFEVPAGPFIGVFRVAGAVSLLPGEGGLDPSVGVNFEYFVNPANGYVRQMMPLSDPGPVWIDGLFTVDDDTGEERMLTHFVRVESFSPVFSLYEQGLALYNDTTDEFERFQEYDLDAPIVPAGHAFRHTVCGEAYIYFAQNYPNIRVKADWSQVTDISRWEAFTPLQEGTRYDVDSPSLELDSKGKPVFGWKRNADPLSTDMLFGLVGNGHLMRDDSPFRLRDVETGEAVRLHRASVHWNAYRDSWIMIFTESFGESFLGEVWLAEAPTPEGPWENAIKVATHTGPSGEYSFYNPKAHPFFEEDGGRIVYFEGTYSNFFTSTAATPLYDYNQILYRLDLSSLPSLAVPGGDTVGDACAPGVQFLRGDVTQDGLVDLGDPVLGLFHLFEGAEVACRDTLDFDDSGTVEITDPLASLQYLFLGGVPPALPGPRDCGVDPTDDSIDCESYAATLCQ